jgi:hypothetical protein
MTLSTNLWHYHTDPSKLIGSDRVQLRTLAAYYGGTLDPDDFPKEAYEQQDEYLQKALVDAGDVGQALFYATAIANKRSPALEHAILHKGLDVEIQQLAPYVHQFFKGHWPEFEKLAIKKIIKSNFDSDTLHHTMFYMTIAGKKSWPDMEKILLDLPESTPDELKYKNKFLVNYAQAIGKRWPAAEPTILRMGYPTMTYIHRVVKAPWPEAERTLVKSNYVRTYLADFPERIDAVKKWGYVPGD